MRSSNAEVLLKSAAGSRLDTAFPGFSRSRRLLGLLGRATRMRRCERAAVQRVALEAWHAGRRGSQRSEIN